jgi:hypothetical protein
LVPLLVFFFFSPSLFFFFFLFVFFPSLLSTNADPLIDRGLRGGEEHEKYPEKNQLMKIHSRRNPRAPNTSSRVAQRISWMELG